MKLIYLSTLFFSALPVCLSAVGVMPPKSSPTNSAETSELVAKSFNAGLSTFDLESHVAKKICERDHTAKECTKITVDKYRGQVHDFIVNQGLVTSPMKLARDDVKPKDPINQCIGACMLLLQRQCAGAFSRHDARCGREAQQKQCEGNCNGARAVVKNVDLTKTLGKME